MDTLQAITIIEGSIASTEEDNIDAWQSLVNSGMVWKLQGWYGRRAMELIQTGEISNKGEE